MTGRIVRVELRRSAAVAVALLALAAGTALLVSFPEEYAGRWTRLATSVRLLLVVWVPLALAGGAWLGRREARSRVGELFASTARPRWQRVTPTAAALAVSLVAGYAVMFLVGAVWVVPSAGYFPAGAVALVAVGALAVVTAGWLGMAAGRAVPRLTTPPALAVAGFAVAGLLPDWLGSESAVSGRPVPAAVLLSPVYGGDLSDFETITSRVNLLQAVWLAALAATGLLLLGAAGRRAAVAAALPALLGAALVLPLLPAGGYDAAARRDPAAVALVCDDDGARVCVTRVHAALLPDVTGAAREVLRLLAQKLPDAPGSAVEAQHPPYWRRPGPAQVRYDADALVFEAPRIGADGRMVDEDAGFLRQALLEAAWWQDCGELSDEAGVRLARQVAAAWLIGTAPALGSVWSDEERRWAERSYRALVELPPVEQGRRMAAARDAVLDCRLDEFRSAVLGGAS